jgi:hypothetical protein
MTRPPLLKDDGGIQLVLEDSRQDKLLVHDRQARPFHLDKEEHHNGKNAMIIEMGTISQNIHKKKVLYKRKHNNFLFAFWLAKMCWPSFILIMTAFSAFP